jgi:hypothetical protein
VRGFPSERILPGIAIQERNGGLNSYGIIRSNNLDFNAQSGGETEFCQTPISVGSSTVVIYEAGTNDCLALNAIPPVYI